MPYLCWWPLFNAPKLDVIVTAEQKAEVGLAKLSFRPHKGGRSVWLRVCR